MISFFNKITYLMIKDNFSDIIVCVKALGDDNTLLKNVKL